MLLRHTCADLALSDLSIFKYSFFHSRIVLTRLRSSQSLQIFSAFCTCCSARPCRIWLYISLLRCLPSCICFYWLRTRPVCQYSAECILPFDSASWRRDWWILFVRRSWGRTRVAAWALIFLALSFVLRWSLVVCPSCSSFSSFICPQGLSWRDN